MGRRPVEGDAGDRPVDARVDHASNSAKTGTWSLGLSQPRTWRAMRLPPERSARSGVAQTWSRRRPLSAACPVRGAVGPPGIERTVGRVGPGHVDPAAGSLGGGEGRDLDGRVRDHLQEPLVVPDVVLARRDVEVADEDRALGRDRREPGAELGEEVELVGELRVQPRVGQVAAGRDVEVVHDRARRQPRRDVARVAAGAEVAMPDLLERQAGEDGDAVVGLLAADDDMAVAERARSPSSGKASTGVLVSWRQSTSGCSSRSRRSIAASRWRTELMFQVQMRTVMAGRTLAGGRSGRKRRRRSRYLVTGSSMAATCSLIAARSPRRRASVVTSVSPSRLQRPSAKISSGWKRAL